MVKRFGVKTQSGSWYYLEDHTHVIGAPTWKLISETGENYIYGLLKIAGNNVMDKVICKNIISIEQFIGYHILFCGLDLYSNYSKHFEIGDEFTVSHMVGRTSIVIEAIQFK